jgi:hypothetical protein
MTKSSGFTLEHEKTTYWVDVQDRKIEVYNSVINGMAYGLMASVSIGDQGHTCIKVLKETPEVVWEAVRAQWSDLITHGITAN